MGASHLWLGFEKALIASRPPKSAVRNLWWVEEGRGGGSWQFVHGSARFESAEAHLAIQAYCSITGIRKIMITGAA